MREVDIFTFFLQLESPNPKDSFCGHIKKLCKPVPEVAKLFMLDSTEHEIYHAHNVKMPTIVGILTFIIA